MGFDAKAFSTAVVYLYPDETSSELVGTGFLVGHPVRTKAEVVIGYSPKEGEIVLGDHVVIGPGCILYGAGGIFMGEYTHLGPGVIE